MGKVLDINLKKFDEIGDLLTWKYWAITMQRYLDKQAAEGNTIYEKDGTSMTMGPFAN